MNSFELERVLSLIQANAQTTQPRVRLEVMRYLEQHEDEVLEQLRANGEVSVSTSLGTVELRLSDLLAAVA